MVFKPIEEIRLSTGQLMYIEQQGRKYSFVLCSIVDGEQPYSVRGINKETAYKLYNEHLQQDITEFEFMSM